MSADTKFNLLHTSATQTRTQTLATKQTSNSQSFQTRHKIILLITCTSLKIYQWGLFILESNLEWQFCLDVVLTAAHQQEQTQKQTTTRTAVYDSFSSGHIQGVCSNTALAWLKPRQQNKHSLLSCGKCYPSIFFLFADNLILQS